VIEEIVVLGPNAVPHHGPVGPRCPIDCLAPVLSLMSFNPLARAYDAPFDPPKTVGDVLDLYMSGRLDKIHGLGPRRISEIEAGLVLAGLDITGPSRPSGPLRSREDSPMTARGPRARHSNPRGGV
jgi:hypothetical protein